MLKSLPIRIAVGVFISAVAGGLALAFGLQRVVADMITDHPLALAGVMLALSGIVGLAGVCAWIALGLEQGLQERFRPKLGSFAYRSIESDFQLEPTGNNKLDIVVTLVNQNDRLVAYTSEMEMAVNAKPVLAGQSENPNFTPASQPASLIFTAHNVPIARINDTVGSVSIVLRYLLRYAYASNWTSASKRTTSKTIVIQAPVWLGPPEQAPPHNKVYPRFIAEQET